MAKPTTVKGSKFLILLGDQASPEVFSAPCGLSTKGIDFSASTNDVNVPDCDDPDAPQWTERVINALSASVTGSGVMAAESFAKWKDWFLAADSRNVQAKIDEVTLGYFSGAFVLTGFRVTGNLGEKIQVELTMQNDGQVTYTANT